MKTINFNGKFLSLQMEYYRCDDSPALQFVDKEGDPYLIASVHVPGLSQDEIAIKEYEMDGIVDALVKADIVSTPHRYTRSGYVTIPVCKLLIPRQ